MTLGQAVDWAYRQIADGYATRIEREAYVGEKKVFIKAYRVGTTIRVDITE